MTDYQSYQAYQPTAAEFDANAAGFRSNYGSHQTYQGLPTEPLPDVGIVRINADAGRTTSVSIHDGVAVTDTTSGQRVLSSELNPHHGDGSVFATARNPRGFAVTEITPDTLITVAGVQGPVSFFEAQGLVHRGTDGRYAEGSGEPEGAPEETPQGSQDADADHMTMTIEAAQSVDDALAVVPDQHIDPLAALGVGVAAGELDMSTMTARFAEYSGVSPEEASTRVATMRDAYQTQADSAITSRCGIDATDLGDFYGWAKENQRGALRDAVQKQIQRNDLSGYRALASRYLAANPPTVEAVKAGGYAVRTDGQRAEVLMDGRWLTIAAAARLGML
jgi:hypothetical protein